MKEISALYQNQNAYSVQEVDRNIYVNYNYPTHLHSRLELIYGMGGSVDINIDGVEMTIGQSDYCLVLPWQKHSFVTHTYSKIIILVIPHRIISRFLENMNELHGETQIFRAEPEFEQLFGRYIVESAECNEYIMTSIIYGICHSFLSSCKLVANENRERNPDMQYVLKYVSERSREKLDLKSVADELGYNYYHLSRMFSKEAKVGFYDFCSSIRIEDAMSRLVHENASVTQIAYDSGFFSIRTFNRTFKRIVGMSPSEYRIFARNNPISKAGNKYLASTEFAMNSRKTIGLEEKKEGK